MKSLLALLAVLFLAAPAAAQSQVELGKPYQLAFDLSATQPGPGWTIVYRAYVDNEPVDAVSGPLEGAAGSHVFVMPAITAPGAKALKVSARARITDAALATCGTGGGAGVVDCTEVFSAPLNITVPPPTVPNPDPATNLRIIRTTTVTETIIDSDGKIVGTSSTTSTVVLAHEAGK